MCVCMYVYASLCMIVLCVYVCTCVFMYDCIVCVCICVLMYDCIVCVCVYDCMCVCMYMRPYVWLYCVYVCMYVCMCVCTYVCMIVCVYVRMYVCMYVCSWQIAFPSVATYVFLVVLCSSVTYSEITSSCKLPYMHVTERNQRQTMKSAAVSINGRSYFFRVSNSFYIHTYIAGRGGGGGEGGRVNCSEPHSEHRCLAVTCFCWLIVCGPTLYKQIVLQATGVKI
jgi:hypothetical protein